ncbi:DUF4365 domain-containing protein [Lutibacter sp.]|uniref:DUF4365 domain-containing protein n=1 Tax=Lutibacter sp. TaxID=1925666 RepID=UPI001A3605A7|nr:DUF4365 domain-containing protein [Lutibacter sp.]MBI9040199.1 DUF4365 domain-containing protein [Lutibacter sp.]
MSRTRFTNTERIGVNKVESIFLKDFEWIPRTIFQSDVGIDMTVEVAENGNPIGQYLAIQIKTGESYFQEDQLGDIIYRGSLDHLDYWLNHSLPVIIILHNPKTDLTIWQEIKNDKITRTAKGWKVEIPKTKTLDINHKIKLLNTNKLPLYLQRFQKIASDKNLIKFINDDGLLILEIDEWINKTSGKAEFRIIKSIDSEDVLISKTGYYHFNNSTSLQILFPWAEFEVDEEYYEQQEEDEFMENYGIWDPEDKCYIGTYEDFHKMRKDYPKIRPLEDGSGEIHFYRLFFNLNSLGKSFLEMDNFMNFGTQLKLFNI